MRFTVTVEVEQYTITGKVRVIDGHAHKAVTVTDTDIPKDQLSWLIDNEDKVSEAVRYAAEGVAQHEADKEKDRGFDIYDDEDSFQGEEFGKAYDDLWG